MATRIRSPILDEAVVADGAAHVSEKAAFDVHVGFRRACYPRFRCASVVPRAGCSGSRGPRLVHVCALGVLFAFGRPDRRAAAAAVGGGVLATRSRWRPSRRPSPSCRSARRRDPRRRRAAVRAWDAPRGRSRQPGAGVRRRPAIPTGGGGVGARARPRASAGGHPPDHAFRRDDSTLRSRLTDGAAECAAGAAAHLRPPCVAPGHPPRAGGRHRRLGPDRDAEPGAGAAPTSPSRSAAPTGAGPAEAHGRGARPRPRRRCPCRRLELAALAGPGARAPGRSTPSRARAASTRAARHGRRQRHPARGLERAAPRAHRFLAAGGAAADRAPRRAAGRARSAGRRGAARAGDRAQPSSAPPTATRRPRTSTSGRARAATQRYELGDPAARQRRARVPQGRWRSAWSKGRPSCCSWSARTGGCRRPAGRQVVGIRGVRRAAMRAVRRAAPFPPMPDPHGSPLSVSMP